MDGNIECFSWETAHQFNDALTQHYRLRHRVFVEHLKWANMTTVRDMEWDQYDTPATWYLLRRDNEGRAIGTIRLVPTAGAGRYMIQDLWPDRYIGPLPQSPRIWEGSRLAADPSLSPRESSRVCAEILAGAAEFGTRFGIDRILHVTTPAVVRGALNRNGLRTELKSDPWQEAGEDVVISETMSQAQDYDAIARRLGLAPSILAVADLPAIVAA